MLGLGIRMWACNICGREHERLHDACWNCPCRNDSAAVRARRRRSWTLTARVALGLAMGSALGALQFYVVGLPAAEGVLPGAQIGLVVGSVWALSVWALRPY